MHGLWVSRHHAARGGRSQRDGPSRTSSANCEGRKGDQISVLWSVHLAIVGGKEAEAGARAG